MGFHFISVDKHSPPLKQKGFCMSHPIDLTQRFIPILSRFFTLLFLVIWGGRYDTIEESLRQFLGTFV